MRFLIVGAGALGGYYGGMLLKGGADVTFLVRPRRAAQLAERGLVVTMPDGEYKAPVKTVLSSALGGPYDVKGFPPATTPRILSKSRWRPMHSFASKRRLLRGTVFNRTGRNYILNTRDHRRLRLRWFIHEVCSLERHHESGRIS